MKDTCILTISIPLFNMEKYFRRCIESVIIPTCLGKYEILIINDGSTDKSLNIAKKYEKEFPQIIRVIDKPNGNWGSCNNRAISEARGTYFRVLDADDYFSKKDTEKFIIELLKLDQTVDLIQTRSCIVKDDMPEGALNVNDIKYNIVYNVEDLAELGRLSLSYSLHTTTINTELLRKHHITLQEGMCYTDIEMFSYSLTHATSIIFFDIHLYRYYLGREGQSVAFESYKKNIIHLERLFKRMLAERNRLLAPPNTNKIRAQARYISNIFFQYCCIFIVGCDYSNERYQSFLQIWNDTKEKFPELRQELFLKKYLRCKVVYLWEIYQIRFDRGLGYFILMVFKLYCCCISILRKIVNVVKK